MSDKIFGMTDMDTIAALADIVSRNDLEEITIVNDDQKITIKGKRNPPCSPPMMPVFADKTAAVQTGDLPPAAASAPAVSGNIVRAPIVGTFYSASAPGKPPFAAVGQQVRKGDVLMIIESMKLMNEIRSDFDGIVSEILVKDGQTVEFDQPIMVIK